MVPAKQPAKKVSSRAWSIISIPCVPYVSVCVLVPCAEGAGLP